MNNNNDHQCQVMHYDLFGRREEKYAFLEANSLDSVPWTELKPEEPYRFFVPKDFSLQEEYEQGFKIDELMPKYNNGIESGKDDLFFAFTQEDIQSRMHFVFAHQHESTLQYDIKDTKDYRLLSAFNTSSYDAGLIKPVHYRPFDIRYCYYSPTLLRRPAYDTMRHMFNPNYALLVPRQCSTDFHHVFMSNIPTNCNLTGTAKKFGSAPIFPLYLYSEDGSIRKPNLNAAIVRRIEEAVGETVEPLTLFDYIYAALHSPTYRTRYRELLKIDFPRIPYPASAAELHRLAAIGARLRQLHLMQGVQAEKGMATFDHEGSNMVDKVEYKGGNVHINSAQCFANVPEQAWTFHIGGYQPAQKWLKDRRGRTLTIDDLMHYRRIIAVLVQTQQAMDQIDASSQND